MKKNAYTLMEVIVVLAIVALSFGLAIGGISNFKESTDMRAILSQVAFELKTTRNNAVNNNIPIPTIANSLNSDSFNTSNYYHLLQINDDDITYTLESSNAVPNKPIITKSIKYVGLNNNFTKAFVCNNNNNNDVIIQKLGFSNNKAIVYDNNGLINNFNTCKFYIQNDTKTKKFEFDINVENGQINYK